MLKSGGLLTFAQLFWTISCRFAYYMLIRLAGKLSMAKYAAPPTALQAARARYDGRERSRAPRSLRPLTEGERRRVDGLLSELPYYGSAHRILVGDGLGERGRKLVLGVAPAESRMHAASFLRHSHIVIDRGLLRRRSELARILYHEIFHFVWARLGNPLRLSYEQLLRQEWSQGARGELGWSAESRKLALARQESSHRKTAASLRRGFRNKPWRGSSGRRLWLDYVCESFCDSAAWFCLSVGHEHREWTLRPRFCDRRRRWLQAADVLPRLQL